MANTGRFFLIIYMLMPVFAFASDEHGASLSGLFWRIFIFGIFAVILYFIFRKRLPAMLSDGVNKIAAYVDNARKACDESEKELADYSRKIAGMNAELEHMKQTARKTAEKEAELMIIEAEKAAIKYKELTTRSINIEFEKAKSALHREAALAAIASAEEILAKDSDQSKKQAYIKENITNIKVN